MYSCPGTCILFWTPKCQIFWTWGGKLSGLLLNCVWMVRMLRRWGPISFSTVTITVWTFPKQALLVCPEWHAYSLLILKSMCFFVLFCYIPVWPLAKLQSLLRYILKKHVSWMQVNLTIICSTLVLQTKYCVSLCFLSVVCGIISGKRKKETCSAICWHFKLTICSILHMQ